MNAKQEQDRLDRINMASHACRTLLHDFMFEDDEASQHIERAKVHLDEAWINADGQKGRTVEQAVADIESYKKLFASVVSADAGTEFKIGGKTFVKYAA